MESRTVSRVVGRYGGLRCIIVVDVWLFELLDDELEPGIFEFCFVRRAVADAESICEKCQLIILT